MPPCRARPRRPPPSSPGAMGYKAAPPPLPDETDGGEDGETPDTPAAEDARAARPAPPDKPPAHGLRRRSDRERPVPARSETNIFKPTVLRHLHAVGSITVGPGSTVTFPLGQMGSERSLAPVPCGASVEHTRHGLQPRSPSTVVRARRELRRRRTHPQSNAWQLQNLDRSDEPPGRSGQGEILFGARMST